MNRESPPQIAWLRPEDPPEAFPDIDAASREPDGLLAAGGDLSEARLVYAYRHGIFPWYEEGQPILWWSPDPRCILRPDSFHVAKRLRRWLAQCPFEVRFNTAFLRVVDGCAAQRRGQHGTWITRDMTTAFDAMHKAGWAHSIEVWHGRSLVGGVYGLAIGNAFFGESMFSRETNASKVALLALCRQLLARGSDLLDCQVVSPHLLTLGATTVARSEFRGMLDSACAAIEPMRDWPTTALPAATLLAGREAG